MIEVVKNRNLIEYIFSYEVILFPMSINNSLSKGFTYELALNFPIIKESENATKYGDTRKYGTIHETKYNNVRFVACYIHTGGYRKDDNGSFVDYSALEQCLKNISKIYHGKEIGSVILGANETDGKGNKEKIIKMFNDLCPNCNITLYDYEQEEHKLKMFRKIAEVRQKLIDKKIDKEEYLKIRSKIEWERKNGIYNEMPEDFKYIPRENKGKLKYIGSKKQN